MHTTLPPLARCAMSYKPNELPARAFWGNVGQPLTHNTGEFKIDQTALREIPQAAPTVASLNQMNYFRLPLLSHP
jgi:hypothetical protein